MVLPELPLKAVIDCQVHATDGALYIFTSVDPTVKFEGAA